MCSQGRHMYMYSPSQGGPMGSAADGVTPGSGLGAFTAHCLHRAIIWLVIQRINCKKKAHEDSPLLCVCVWGEPMCQWVCQVYQLHISQALGCLHCAHIGLWVMVIRPRHRYTTMDRYQHTHTHTHLITVPGHCALWPSWGRGGGTKCPFHTELHI